MEECLAVNQSIKVGRQIKFNENWSKGSHLKIAITRKIHDIFV